MAKINWKTEEDVLEELKKVKSDEMSRECQKRILDGFNENMKDIKYHFSYDAEAQINFQETYLLFANGVIEEVNWTVMNDSGEKIRIALGKEDFQKVYFESINHKLGTISHYRDTLAPMIKTTRTKEELEQIDWGMTPAGDHLIVSPEKALDKKVGTISGEVIAQKQVNMQMETIILDVADLALSSIYS